MRKSHVENRSNKDLVTQVTTGSTHYDASEVWWSSLNRGRAPRKLEPRFRTIRKGSKVLVLKLTGGK